jgi:hypothetical protein
MYLLAIKPAFLILRKIMLMLLSKNKAGKEFFTCIPMSREPPV